MQVKYKSVAIISFLLQILIFLCSENLSAQIITGRLKTDGAPPDAGLMVVLRETEYKAITNANGIFRIYNVPAGRYTMISGTPDRYLKPLEFEYDGQILDLGNIEVSPTTNILIKTASEIAIVSIDDLEQIEEDESLNFSGLLTASRDPFDEAVAFNLSAGRFRARGYNLEDTELYLNGMPVNNLIDGRIFWNTWGGLNDVMRSQINSLNLRNNEFAFGGLGGASFIDLRAQEQRVQTKGVYTLSNRTYQHRLMLTHSSGLLKNGWAYTFSFSKRWGSSGYIEGTHFDAYSYFMSLDKRLNDRHSLNFVFLGAPLRRGRSGGSFQEMYDIAGSNFYNPNWGFQNGQVRNSREDRIHQPIAMLRYDWAISNTTKLTTVAGIQFGKSGTTRLDWYLAPDPRPDYYRKLPSFMQNEHTRDLVFQELSKNQAARQLNFDAFFQVNRNNFITLENVDGVPGQNVSGNLSAYVIEEQRTDNNKFSIHSFLNTAIGKNNFFTGGVMLQSEITNNFKVLDDLLGGDFYVNVERFAILDFPSDAIELQNDIDHPNRIIRKGDIFGYNFDIISNNAQIFGQIAGYAKRMDYFISSKLEYTSFYREGYMRNGRFPQNSAGKSTVNEFFTGQIKAGLTFKMDGRNYLYGVALYGSRAPFARWAYISPRFRPDVVTGLQKEELKSVEAGYVFRFPWINGRFTAFYTEVNNTIRNNSFYHDELRTFVNYVINDVDRRHAGVEMGAKVKLHPNWGLKLAGTVGQHIFTSRPLATITQDNSAKVLAEGRVVYIKNFYVPGTPQSAGTIGLNYNSPHFWFVNLNANFFAKNYMDFNPDRRTKVGVDLVNKNENPELWNSIIAQEELPSNYTIDVFFGKSWRVRLSNKNYFINLNVSVSNLLNNTQFITGGFEQFRFDYVEKDVNKFPPRYFYGFGRNYSINLSVRI